MKVLTVKQPWPWLIFHGGKDVENRSWRTDYRGPLAIHCSAKLDLTEYHAACSLCHWLDLTMPPDPLHLRHGSIIGVVDLVDCLEDSASLWHCDGSWGWLLRNPRLLEKPIPAKGRLGLWNHDVPDPDYATR